MENRRRDTDRRVGRPRLTAERRKSQVLAVKTTPEEMDLFYRIASRANTTATLLLRAYVRSVITASSGNLR